jgi:predicted transcriptional regulator
MCEAPVNEETKEKQRVTLNNALQVFEELTKETKTLYEEKTSLLDIEGKLMLKINEEIENVRQRKEQLKAEVEDLRRRCDELVAFLNSRTAEFVG